MKNNCKTNKNIKNIIARLRALSSPRNIAGMARFGVNPDGALGVPMPAIRRLGKAIGKDHALALKLLKTGIHEARILAAIAAEPEKLTDKEIDSFVNDFDSWDVCDQACLNLLDKLPDAFERAAAWSVSDKEFIKRAGFALMAVLAVHDKAAGNAKFMKFFPLIKKGAADERNFVIKAVNWALRQIGKRNGVLYKKASSVARELLRSNLKSANWAAKDALREFASLKGYAKNRVSL